MKHCPQCNLNYSDATLEFCLEDGTRLLASNENRSEATITIPKNTNPIADQTVVLPASNPLQNYAAGAAVNPAKPGGLNLPTEKIAGINAGINGRVLETAPIVLALAHNWWQWIYLNSQYYSSFTAYILSANFLMWLLLLVVGVIIGLISFKRSENKSFAVTSLVIIAINLLLILVPKR